MGCSGSIALPLAVSDPRYEKRAASVAVNPLVQRPTPAAASAVYVRRVCVCVYVCVCLLWRHLVVFVCVYVG